jgi:hypothetical protein
MIAKWNDGMLEKWNNGATWQWLPHYSPAESGMSKAN